jgi:mono/diheme cytochrome c family protein
MIVRLAAAAAALLSLAVAASAAEPPANADKALIELGRRIYVDGVLPSGQPLKGMRFDSVEVSGARAACVACHRRSGMGGVEGDLQVPPINGRFLFAERGDMALAIMDPRVGKMMNRAHVPYTEATLAAAIRGGVNNSGTPMNVAMPHFDLADADMKALIAYLTALSANWSPGVSDDSIRFATVITPGVDPQRRQLLLDMLNAAFLQKNGSTIVAAPGAKNPGRRHMTSAAELVLGTERKWILDVWELKGAPETWAEQLQENYRRQPVFALLSGLSSGAWQPVHDFCEIERVPCWFPSVDLPPAEPAVYPLYFSRGVALEAEILAAHLRSAAAKPQRLIQVYRDDIVGRGAALALTQALQGSGVTVADKRFDPARPASLREALATIKDKDAAMLWLTPDEIAGLDPAPKGSGPAYLSATLADPDSAALPEAWRKRTQLVYPYELPSKRLARLSYFHAWLKLRRLPLIDEPLQSEVYFAVNFMTDTVAEMLDNLYRDYLIERAEDMIGKRETGKAEGETRERAMIGTPEQLAKRYPKAKRLDEAAGLSLQPGQAPSLMSTRGGTTVYPRLTLGPGQRYASKGGYIARFGDGGELVAESGWIVPR